MKIAIIRIGNFIHMCGAEFLPKKSSRKEIYRKSSQLTEGRPINKPNMVNAKVNF